jgi:hypothetical protein
MCVDSKVGRGKMLDLKLHIVCYRVIKDELVAAVLHRGRRI